MRRECKILMVEFFNSLVLVQSLHEVLGCSRYVNSPTGGEVCFVYRQAISAVDRPPHSCQQAFLESRVLCRLAKSIDSVRPLGSFQIVFRVRFCSEFESFGFLIFMGSVVI